MSRLLKCQKDYWRKRYTVRWTKSGDENTTFFHAAAIDRYRLNTITTLDTQDGRTISTHSEKASLIWEEYRNRLGCSTQPQMYFTLQQLVQEHDLQSITKPFTKEDIDMIVKTMPGDKAPGSDGFYPLAQMDLMAYLSRSVGTLLKMIYMMFVRIFSVGW
jgi:hypothetical protein